MKRLRTSSSLNLHAYPRDNLFDYVRQGLLFHQKMGLDAADLDMELFDSVEDLTPYMEQALLDATSIGVGFELCHLPYSSCNSKSEAGKARFSALMHRAIDAAKLLGVRYAVLHPNTTTLPLEAFDRAAQYDAVTKHLAPFVEHAAKVGLELAVENLRMVSGPTPSHRYCQSPDELCEIADTFGIGVCWDFGHANIGGERQSDRLAYVGKRLKVLHVNDNFGINDEHLLPFMGTVDWKDAMQGLSLVGFDGLLNFEVSTWRVPTEMRESFAGYAKQAAETLMSYMD